MVQHVTLDAMIPREDFAVEGDEMVLNLSNEIKLSELLRESPTTKQLRKPDFQRETNHWSPDQIVAFIASFLDNEVIPSIILWKSPSYVFVIDGGHRLSALRAWVEDDYGDRTLSQQFYNHEISNQQKRIAKRTRDLVEKEIGRFTTLQDLVGRRYPVMTLQNRRAGLLFNRSIQVQWIQGNAAAAEKSFFRINSQGTPLNDIETLLIVNRRKPIAIGARALLRAGSGHRYWSAFTHEKAAEIESLATEFHNLVFLPEVNSPTKTLDLPIGGTVSPIDALALLVEFLAITASNDKALKVASDYPDDEDGTSTIESIRNTLKVIKRITGNNSPSLGLHPAVFFYNEKGKFSRFLFLGIILMIKEKIGENNHTFFLDFSVAREAIEGFLVANKSLIGILLQQMNKHSRIARMKEMFLLLMKRFNSGETVTVESLVTHLGMKGRIIDAVDAKASTKIVDDIKSIVFVKQALSVALRCPICCGLIDTTKSASYDHNKDVKYGGTGTESNVQITHPFCNSAKEAIHVRRQAIHALRNKAAEG